MPLFLVGQAPGLVKIPQVSQKDRQADARHHLSDHHLGRHAEHHGHNPRGGQDFRKPVEEDPDGRVNVALPPPAVFELCISIHC